jgi:hypothetical protein
VAGVRVEDEVAFVVSLVVAGLGERGRLMTGTWHWRDLRRRLLAFQKLKKLGREFEELVACSVWGVGERDAGAMMA